jgi:hypothetical protein
METLMQFFGLQTAYELIDVTMTSDNRAYVGHLGSWIT